MAHKEKGIDGVDPSNDEISPSQPLLQVKKEEPMDDYEGMDKDRLIAKLKEQLTECEKRAKKAEEEHAVAVGQEMEWIVKSAESERIRVSAEQQLEKGKEEAARTVEAEQTERRKLEDELNENKAAYNNDRKEWNGTREEMEKRIANLEEWLKTEMKERVKEKDEWEKEKENERRETMNRQAEMLKKNEDLQDQVNSLTERMKNLELSLTEERSKTVAQADQWVKDLVEQKEEHDEEESRLKAVINWAERELMDTKSAAAEAKAREVKLKEDLEEMKNKLLFKNDQSKSAEAKEREEKLKEELEEMRNINFRLATTETGKIYAELTVARKRIEILEKEIADNLREKMPSMEEDTPDIVETENMRRSSRIVTKSGGDGDPPVKKSRSEPTEKSDNKRRSNKGESQKESTLQCILCEAYPSTPIGYAAHLRHHHKSSLKANGIYLRCACNVEFYSENSRRQHNANCIGDKFTLHKLDEKRKE